MQTLLRHKYKGGADHRHEHRWNERNDIVEAPFPREPHGEHPEGEDGERLVGPTEILPYHIESVGIIYLPEEYQDGHGKERRTDHKTLTFRCLREMEEVGHDKAG